MVPKSSPINPAQAKVKNESLIIFFSFCEQKSYIGTDARTPDLRDWRPDIPIHTITRKTDPVVIFLLKGISTESVLPLRVLQQSTYS
jgi:hypothetical protein